MDGWVFSSNTLTSGVENSPFALSLTRSSIIQLKSVDYPQRRFVQINQCLSPPLDPVTDVSEVCVCVQREYSLRMYCSCCVMLCCLAQADLLWMLRHLTIHGETQTTLCPKALELYWNTFPLVHEQGMGNDSPLWVHCIVSLSVMPWLWFAIK